jgi:hypothetical protein
MFWGLMLAPDRCPTRFSALTSWVLDLMEAMGGKAESFGAQMVRDDVTAVSLICPVKTVTEAPAPPGRPAPSSWRGLGLPPDRDPRLIKDVIYLDERGHVKVAGRSTATNVDACSPPGTWSPTPTGRRSPPAGSGCPAALTQNTTSTPSTGPPASPNPDTEPAEGAVR